MDTDPLERNDDLDRRIALLAPVMGKRITGLQRVVRWVVIGVVMDVLLTVVIGLFGYITYGLSNQARDAASLARINCLAANETRALSKQLWDYVLSLPPSGDESPAARQTRLRDLAKFKVFIAKAFIQRNCSSTNLGNMPGTLGFPILSAPSAGRLPSPSAVPVVVDIEPSPSRSTRPQPAVTPAPVQTRRRRPTLSPSPAPSPSPLCILGHCI